MGQKGWLTKGVDSALRNTAYRDSIKVTGYISQEELKALVRKVVRDIAAKRKITVRIDSESGMALITSLTGLTLSEAERVLTRCIMEDGRLDANDIPALLEIKKEKIPGAVGKR